MFSHKHYGKLELANGDNFWTKDDGTEWGQFVSVPQRIIVNLPLSEVTVNKMW